MKQFLSVTVVAYVLIVASVADSTMEMRSNQQLFNIPASISVAQTSGLQDAFLKDIDFACFGLAVISIRFADTTAAQSNHTTLTLSLSSTSKQISVHECHQYTYSISNIQHILIFSQTPYIHIFVNNHDFVLSLSSVSPSLQHSLCKIDASQTVQIEQLGHIRNIDKSTELLESYYSQLVQQKTDEASKTNEMKQTYRAKIVWAKLYQQQKFWKSTMLFRSVEVRLRLLLLDVANIVYLSKYKCMAEILLDGNTPTALHQIEHEIRFRLTRFMHHFTDELLLNIPHQQPVILSMVYLDEISSVHTMHSMTTNGGVHTNSMSAKVQVQEPQDIVQDADVVFQELEPPPPVLTVTYFETDGSFTTDVAEMPPDAKSRALDPRLVAETESDSTTSKQPHTFQEQEGKHLDGILKHFSGWIPIAVFGGVIFVLLASVILVLAIMRKRKISKSSEKAKIATRIATRDGMYAQYMAFQPVLREMKRNNFEVPQAKKSREKDRESEEAEYEVEEKELVLTDTMMEKGEQSVEMANNANSFQEHLDDAMVIEEMLLDGIVGSMETKSKEFEPIN